jgi:hypothetical protein
VVAAAAADPSLEHEDLVFDFGLPQRVAETDATVAATATATAVPAGAPSLAAPTAMALQQLGSRSAANTTQWVATLPPTPLSPADIDEDRETPM